MLRVAGLVGGLHKTAERSIMRTNKAERVRQFYASASRLGITPQDADSLRRIEMTLHRWAEACCNGDIQRDDDGGKPFRHYGRDGGPYLTVRTADRESGALRRLGVILSRYPGLLAYHQGDPRGCALYILAKSDIREGESLDCVYSRGWAVAR